MARSVRRRARRLIIDVDTQVDLFRCNGAVSPQLLANMRRLMAWARLHHVPIISTTLARRREDCTVVDEDRGNCIEGTVGQKKIGYTTLPRRLVFAAENSTDLPRQLFRQYQQLIFEKRSEDPFEQPRAERLLTSLRADELIVFGMLLEKAVKLTVLGLLYRGKNVTLVTDAVRGTTRREAIIGLRQMEAKGANLIETSQLTGRSRLVGRAGIRLLRRARQAGT